jgi:hypothetical protein
MSMLAYQQAYKYESQHSRQQACPDDRLSVSLPISTFMCKHFGVFGHFFVLAYLRVSCFMFSSLYVCSFPRLHSAHMYVCTFACFSCLHVCLLKTSITITNYMFHCWLRIYVRIFTCMLAAFMFTCSHACMIVYLHACIFVRWYACMFLCLHVCMLACLYALHSSKFVCLHVNVCMLHVFMFLCLHACTFGCLHVYVLACLHAGIFACWYVCVLASCMYT